MWLYLIGSVVNELSEATQLLTGRPLQANLPLEGATGTRQSTVAVGFFHLPATSLICEMPGRCQSDIAFTYHCHALAGGAWCAVCELAF